MPNLLTIPPELRLKIYSHLLHLCPLPQPDLAPGYPTPPPTPHLVAPLLPSRDGPLLPAYRPQGYVPTSVLVSCKQIYYECRMIPFQQNEFVLPKFFASGLVPAEVMVRSLEEWQRKEVRWVRIEVGADDLECFEKKNNNKEGKRRGEEGINKWGRVCERLEGVRGLRIRIDGCGGGVWGGDEELIISPSAEEGGEYEERWKWVDDGLKKLKRLNWLEIEVRVGDVKEAEDERKVQWCRSVERRLNDEGGNGEDMVRAVVVVAVAAAKVGSGMNKEECAK
ncbi:hypothetical protein QBC42DRAFT_223482 [Cladorrhinum samala]|uniref:Uncharacterized protein n=1 Tax=Cladorrhinum samala TaxID=585594 RepID=A0AAV9HQX8_9PEZI|nr:hypothetical protein QBC42DRAFT_223482 [Cladorrhinum samala]